MAKVKVPKAVLDGLEAVRRSGLTNMLDRPVVAELAEEFGFEGAARWIRTHRPEFADYAQLRITCVIRSLRLCHVRTPFLSVDARIR